VRQIRQFGLTARPRAVPTKLEVLVVTAPHVYINNKKTSFSGRTNQLSGISTTSGVQFQNQKPTGSVERTHRNIIIVIN
jgi:hypothetical protein